MFENFTLSELLMLRQGVENHYVVENGVFSLLEINDSNYVFKKFNKIIMAISKGVDLLELKKDTLEIIDKELKSRES
jgi:hypothetical protein